MSEPDEIIFETEDGVIVVAPNVPELTADARMELEMRAAAFRAEVQAAQREKDEQ